MKRATVLFLFLCFLVFPFSSVESVFASRELTVSAASSLTDAFGEIGKEFEKANPDTKVVFNFGASGVLLQQIDKGAPVDVFASADQKTMDQAKEKNLIDPNSRRNFTSNGLVLIVPKGTGTTIKTLKDLTSSKIGKIAIGNPDSVPAGRYTRDSLTSEGLWEELKPKFVPGESVRQVLDYVSRGEVDAGFVFATDAAVAKDRTSVALEAKGHQPITYPIAVVRSTKDAALADKFIQFVLGREGQDVLARYGFQKP